MITINSNKNIKKITNFSDISYTYDGSSFTIFMLEGRYKIATVLNQSSSNATVGIYKNGETIKELIPSTVDTSITMKMRFEHFDKLKFDVYDAKCNLSLYYLD